MAAEQNTTNDAESKFEVKTDCFAYEPGKSDRYACSALNYLYCKKEKCGFYKKKGAVKNE